MTAAEAPILEVRSVSKRFGAALIFRKLSVAFSAGERVLMLGANGAGKSTLLRMLAGTMRPDSGQISRRSGANVGFVPHQLLLYTRLTVRENLALFARNVPASRIDGELERWGLSAQAGKLVGELSKGNQAKVSIVRATLPRPSVLVFDEPSSNLDEQAASLLCGSIVEATSATDVPSVAIIATHDVHRMVPVANRVVVLGGGGIQRDSGPFADSATISGLVDLYREGNR